jgi:hypothetical protein
LPFPPFDAKPLLPEIVTAVWPLAAITMLVERGVDPV